jgi:hypothetical protein
VETEGLRVYPTTRPARRSPPSEEVEPLEYTWKGWNRPAFYERKKEGFEILRKAYANNKQLEESR